MKSAGAAGRIEEIDMTARTLFTLTALVLLLAAGASPAADAAARAGWLADRAAVSQPTLHRAAAAPPQSDVGGIGGSSDATYAGPAAAVAKPLLLSLLMPGLGEASMGYKRGYLMMALDLASWYGVKHYHDLGHEKRQEYYEYLDAHWSEDRLANAFGTAGEAGTYFYGDTMDDPSDYMTLSLWVSREDDEREYYENAGKWDQFVFGWDDFADPRTWPEYAGQWELIPDDVLKNPRVSSNRETYRAMRLDSNDQFDTRDTLIYVNMATRLFSMVQVAWLGGVFSGGEPASLRVAGHDVSLIAEPRGLLSSRLGLSVTY